MSCPQNPFHGKTATCRQTNPLGEVSPENDDCLGSRPSSVLLTHRHACGKSLFRNQSKRFNGRYSAELPNTHLSLGRNGYENIRRFFCQRILKTVPAANFHASVLKCGPEPTLQHLRLVFSRPSPSPIHHRRGCRRRCSVPARS